MLKHQNSETLAPVTVKGMADVIKQRIKGLINLAKLLQVAEKWKGSFALLLKKLKTAIKNLLRLELFDKNLLLNPISNSCVA